MSVFVAPPILSDEEAYAQLFGRDDNLTPSMEVERELSLSISEITKMHRYPPTPCYGLEDESLNDDAATKRGFNSLLLPSYRSSEQKEGGK